MVWSSISPTSVFDQSWTGPGLDSAALEREHERREREEKAAEEEERRLLEEIAAAEEARKRAEAKEAKRLRKKAEAERLAKEKKRQGKKAREEKARVEATRADEQPKPKAKGKGKSAEQAESLMDLDTNLAWYGKTDEDEEAESLWKILEEQKVERAHIRVAEKKGELSKKGKQAAKEDELSQARKRSRVGTMESRGWQPCDA